MGRPSASHEKVGPQTSQTIAFSVLVALFSATWTHAVPLRVRVGEGAQARVVNVELEEYLAGVVSAEMNVKEFPAAALEAQAIAARSYAVTKQREARARGRAFDLEGSVADQVFNPEKSSSPRALEAVAKTRGQILVDQKTQAVFAPYYHSTCGGRTELPAHVWGKQSNGAPHYMQRQCAFCGDSPRARWESALPQVEIAKRLVLQNGEQVVQWRLQISSAGKRAQTLEAVTNLGRQIMKSGQEWRSRLGFDVLRSLRLEQPELRGDQWVFRGKGAGHGVGMCQWGARGAARQGWSAQQILQHYYPFARVAQF